MRVALLAVVVTALTCSSGCIIIALEAAGQLNQDGASSQPSDAGTGDPDASAQESGLPVEPGDLDAGAPDLQGPERPDFDAAPTDHSRPDAVAYDSAPDDGGMADGSTFDGPSLDTGPHDGSLPLDEISLDPTQLTFFGLPINSLRYAVSGPALGRDLCVTIIFDYSNTGHDLHSQCNDFGDMFPYVVMAPRSSSPNGSCGGWDYTANGMVVATQGCVDFADFGAAHANLVGLQVNVQSTLFWGVINLDNRALASPALSTFELRVSSAVPEEIWLQWLDDTGAPGWVTIERNGTPLDTFDRCGARRCDESAPRSCQGIVPFVNSITHGQYQGSAAMTWDGKQRLWNDAGQCYDVAELVPLGAADQFTARFCFGWQTTSGVGPYVVSPLCRTIGFAPAAAHVTLVAPLRG